MIIVEGPDNSGKSTLIKSLVKDFDLLIAEKPHGPPKNVQDLINRTSKLLLRQDSKRYIIDRYPIFSEQVYGPTLRNKNLWDDNPVIHNSLINILRNSNSEGSVFIIYCRPPDEVVLNLNTHEVKDYDTPEHLKALQLNCHKVLKAYDNLMGSWANFVYNYKEKDSYKLLTTKLRKDYFDECK